ncbi:putative membrane protein YqgA involved in biofilm formation [Peribacillus deserti]|uniref:Membrane protein YqgA involved in biofilm formation n=1 Tax=Peribacillus deserti TaxID=673318 RepID=A0ABS2QMT4_9BACI|nr:DUF554 domain-containing protein [Peribacillus deserti]MBM7693566.1 putative membrane protein YqgA involved in biofilm formation [Peribacillus deserti]
MVLMGTLVNAACIIVGTLLGKIFHRIPEKIKETVMFGIGLAVIVLGLQMGFKSKEFLIVILSLVFGGVLGEWWDLDAKLNGVGDWLEGKIGGKTAGEQSISQGFVTATLIFLIGAMAIIGALDSGIRGDHDVLYTKAVIDGFTALVLATTLGIGVVFSAIPVLLYQGLIAIFANQINEVVPKELMDSFIMEMTSAGGIMIFAIGLNLIGLTKIRVANLLPGILITAVLVTILYFIPITI